ncbi:MAG: winged helix-turn-helix transcriptional regulator [Ectothiorhodospiraceae bacterium]|nr:winged helix-turn-helix transcriptional regulator [Ectothiorhodospiraceae bacterium]
MALENDTGRMQRRLSMLVGAVEKVGFIPAGIALYYAALQASVVPPHVEYRLTPLGEEISHRVRVLADWIEVNLEEILEAGEPGEQA